MQIKVKKKKKQSDRSLFWIETLRATLSLDKMGSLTCCCYILAPLGPDG